jgi:hypothetical protein
MIYAADVVGQEGPGKLQLKLIKPKHAAHVFGEHVMGCLHVSDPMHENRHNVHTQTGGSWDYLPGVDIPDAHYATARAEIARRKAHKQREVEQRLARETAIKAEEEAARTMT